MSINPTRIASRFLLALAEELQVPDSRYRAAERSYESIASWFHRDASTIKDVNPKVYVQGSFRLGTAIQPFSTDEHYDLDIVCEVDFDKSKISQSELKAKFEFELAAYAKSKGMTRPVEGRRCWTLNYHDEAQFHVDTLPSLYAAADMSLRLEHAGLPTEWADTAIAITDIDHPTYAVVNHDWYLSNPKGYSNWFRSRMQLLFDNRRQAIALKEHSDVESIPEYRVRTPLQYAIQLLKRHRDIMFEEDPTHKPISIIITTLAGLAYQQEETIEAALYGILARMADYIIQRDNKFWISNPSNPTENFADRWSKFPERKDAFYQWLQKAQSDFSAFANLNDSNIAQQFITEALGEKLATAVAKRANTSVFGRVGQGIGQYLSPPWKKEPYWETSMGGDVQILKGVARKNGFRPMEFTSDSSPLSKNMGLDFMAFTDIPKPYEVYWQVVNTGDEAKEAESLRGGFDVGVVSSGELSRHESTLYAGQHSIECFIIKNGRLAARSGQFLVNIG